MSNNRDEIDIILSDIKILQDNIYKVEGGIDLLNNQLENLKDELSVEENTLLFEKEVLKKLYEKLLALVSVPYSLSERILRLDDMIRDRYEE